MQSFLGAGVLAMLILLWLSAYIARLPVSEDSFFEPRTGRIATMVAGGGF